MSAEKQHAIRKIQSPLFSGRKYDTQDIFLETVHRCSTNVENVGKADAKEATRSIGGNAKEQLVRLTATDG